MLPFPIQLQAGEPIYEQIVHAVKRALATEHLKPGDRFPAVRAISAELRINPNTVQKAVSALVAGGVLEIRSGQGSFVAQTVAADRREQARTLPTAYVILLTLLAYLIGFFLTLDLIQIDSPTRELRFLSTRPVPGEAIFFAKILFLGLFLILGGWGLQELDYAVWGVRWL